MPAPTRRQTGAAVGLPRFAYDPRGRGAKYVDLQTGRYVSQTAIQDLLRGYTQSAEARMELLGLQYANGGLTGREFYEAMTREVKLVTNANTALARGGWAQVTPSDWGRNGYLLRTEYERLRQLVSDREAGLITNAQLTQRAGLYANTAYGRYWELETERQAAAGIAAEKLVTVGDDRVCPECQAAEARGWQPLGTWTIPLHVGCRCDKDWQQPEARA